MNGVLGDVLGEAIGLSSLAAVLLLNTVNAPVVWVSFVGLSM
jgi:hypothetical protein